MGEDWRPETGDRTSSLFPAFWGGTSDGTVERKGLLEHATKMARGDAENIAETGEECAS